ncbi:unnamed protein product [Penicillium manginii]
MSKRKQKCGGFTYGIKCRPCTTRKVKCSFDEEVKDPRHYPYLRLRSSKSPPIRRERTFAENEPEDVGLMGQISSPLSPLQGEPISISLPAGLAREPTSSNDDGLPQQVEMLKSRLADLEKRFTNTQHDRSDSINTPRSLAAASLQRPSELSESHGNYRSSPTNYINVGSFSNSDSHSLCSPQAPAITDGPLKTLNNFQEDETVEVESHDPITRSIITEGEAYEEAYPDSYFSSCHPNAPFLDIGFDSDVERLRSDSTLLFLAILSIGARFWSASSKY